MCCGKASLYHFSMVLKNRDFGFKIGLLHLTSCDLWQITQPPVVLISSSAIYMWQPHFRVAQRIK